MYLLILYCICLSFTLHDTFCHLFIFLDLIFPSIPYLSHMVSLLSSFLGVGNLFYYFTMVTVNGKYDIQRYYNIDFVLFYFVYVLLESRNITDISFLLFCLLNLDLSLWSCIFIYKHLRIYSEAVVDI